MFKVYSTGLCGNYSLKLSYSERRPMLSAETYITYLGLVKFKITRMLTCLYRFCLLRDANNSLLLKMTGFRRVYIFFRTDVLTSTFNCEYLRNTAVLHSPCLFTFEIINRDQLLIKDCKKKYDYFNFTVNFKRLL